MYAYINAENQMFMEKIGHFMVNKYFRNDFVYKYPSSNVSEIISIHISCNLYTSDDLDLFNCWLRNTGVMF